MYVSIVLVLLLVLHSRVDCMTKNGTKTCSQLTTVSQNIPQTLILKNPAQGHNLEICQSNLTCCSKQMENELYMKSSRVLKHAVHQQTNITHHFLTTQASVFDGYFKNLLKTATARWHNMLFSTYKEMYTPNRYIFDEFFSSLNNYYVNGDVDQLDKSFDVFFRRIQSTMITLINKTLASQPGFLNCTSRRIAEIQPFGKYQSQITNQLKPSLVQARTLVLGLRAGSNVTASLINYLTRDECVEIFTKMQHCSVCEGIPNALACNATCHNILQSCFALNPLVHASWIDFIRGVNLLSYGIDSQYDFEAVVGQLAFEISYAIMEFQNNFITVFSKALRLCPLGNRKKRAIDRSGSDLYLEGERMRRSLISLSSPTKQPPAAPLNTFTAAFRKQLNGIKYVWKDLPQKICGGQTFVSRDHNTSCWNGIEMQKNSVQVPSLKSSSIDSRQSWIPIAEQLLKLKQILVSVSGALRDNEESASGEPDYSGSGSGFEGSVDPSGSADLPTPVSTPGFTSDLLTKIPSSTDQIPVILSTTDRSILVRESTDEEDGSGVQYTTTLSSTTDDDEDFGDAGSGSETPMTENKIKSKPTTTNILIKTILATKPEDNVPGGSGNMITISYFSVLLVTLVGLANM